jgi:endonuclease YncB( thermonuclease family)
MEELRLPVQPMNTTYNRSLFLSTIGILAVSLLILITASCEAPAQSGSSKPAPPRVGAADEHAIQGKAVAIADGETLTLLTEGNKQIKVRLAGIDAPESRQAFGRKAKQNLSDLIFGKTVRVAGSKTDRYGRLITKILLEDEDINLRQVTDGFAWHFKRYEREQTVKDRKAYATAEREAREAGLGLWSDKNPVAPWDFRKGSE